MQPTPSASYSLTLRVRLSSRAGSLGELTIAIGRAGGDIGAIDIVNVGNDYIIRDITVSSVSSKHGELIVETVKAVDGVDAFPICLNTKDPDEIVRTVKAISTAFGGINVETAAHQTGVARRKGD